MKAGIYKRNITRLTKAVFFIITLFFVLLGSSAAVCAENTAGEDYNSEIIEQQSGSDEMRSIEDQLKKYATGDSREILQGYDPESIIKDVAGGKLEFNFKSIAGNALRYLFNEIYKNLDILIKIVALTILCALLKSLQSSFMSESVGEMAFYACYIVIVTILLVSFGAAMKMGMSIIDDMVGFMYATIPVMITLLVAGGNITSSGIFQPLMIMVVQVSATLIRNFFMPLIFLSTLLSVVNNISEKIQLSRFTSLIKQIIAWTLGTILTVFIGVVSLQGSLGAVIDGVTSKTAKFAIATFIPIVGKTLSDAADTVVGCTLLIKNAAGLAVLIGVLAICIVPLIKILALIALYKSAAALLEPISEKRITGCIGDVAGSMVYIFAVTAAVAFMFLISVTALISASNLSAMVR